MVITRLDRLWTEERWRVTGPAPSRPHPPCAGHTELARHGCLCIVRCLLCVKPGVAAPIGQPWHSASPTTPELQLEDQGQAAGDSVSRALTALGPQAAASAGNMGLRGFGWGGESASRVPCPGGGHPGSDREPLGSFQTGRSSKSYGGCVTTSGVPTEDPRVASANLRGCLESQVGGLLGVS